MKEDKFDLEHAHEALIDAKKCFIKAFTSGIKDTPKPEMDPSMLKTFLETCMKLLRYSKVLKGLQELINRCVGTMPHELHVVHKIRKHKKRMGHEMRLTMQIAEYEMVQVILDFGSYANILLKQTWERMGRPLLQRSPI